ncbi:MAG: sigma-70 family RNA polymerase sigma factor [Bacteroidia bacterium]
MGNNPSYKNLTDADLIRIYKSERQMEVVGALYARYSHLVFGVCMKYLKDEDESKDAASQVFEKLVKELLRHDVDNFRGWLHTVTKFHCLMLLRSGKKEITGMDPGIMEKELSMHPSGLSTDEVLEKERLLQLLENAMGELDEHQQRCIRLFYLEEKSYLEVSEITGYTLNQVKSYIQNGKRNLKILMTKDEHQRE